MANLEQLEILKEGVEEWNRWRDENRGLRPDLRQVSLQGANLQGANLQSADLQGANLQAVNLKGARLLSTNLRGANLADAFLGWVDLALADLTDCRAPHSFLAGANLSGSFLVRTDLTYADLSGAKIRRANLNGADLSHANLSDDHMSTINESQPRRNEQTVVVPIPDIGATLLGCTLAGTKLLGAYLGGSCFQGLSLQSAEGLSEVRHRSPSAIGSMTLQMSKGQIPDEFLKGCGLTDWEILAARLHDPDLREDEVTDILYEIDRLRGESPIVPLSVFISYNREDQQFVEKLEGWFDKDRIRSWRDLKDMKAGPWEAQVDRAIGLQKTVVLVLSERSIRSKWVRAEVERAQEVREELEKRSDDPVHVLCPVALDDAWKKDRSWPRVLRMEIKRYNILDFSMWETDEDAFEAQYEKLKTGLGIYYRK